MFAVLKKLFRRSGSDGATAKPASTPAAPPPPPGKGQKSKDKNRGAQASAKTASGKAAAPPPRATTPASAPALVATGGDALSVPYGSIVRMVPQDLWGKLAPAGCANASFSINKTEALKQLAQGAVKVSFGQLRRAAPQGVFTESAAHDQKLIDLPLAEILPRLHPDSLTRRPNQRRVEVPAEVSALFGPKGEHLGSVKVVDKGDTAQFRRSNTTGTSPTAFTRANTPAAQIAGSPGKTFPSNPAGIAAPAPAAVAEPAPIAFSGGSKTTFFQRKNASPAPAPGAADTSASGQLVVVSGNVEVGLADLADEWPMSIRQEIAQIKSPNPKCALPLAEIGEALKRGKVQYPWKQIRAWIRPELPADARSANDDIVLELPQKILTPLYLDKARGTSFFKKTSYADARPDVLTRSAKEVAPPIAQPSGGTSIAAPKLPLPAQLKPAQATPAPAPLPKLAPTPAPAPTASAPAASGSTLSIPLEAVAGAWPDAIRQEVEANKLGQGQIEIPLDTLQTDLKLGKLVYPWKQVLSWLNPGVMYASPQAELRVELPLAYVAPRFLKQRPVTVSKKAAAHSDIPDLFNPKDFVKPPAAAEAPAAPSAAPKATAPSAPSSPAPVATPVKTPTTLSELFNLPADHKWTPNDIIQRTAALPSLAGAVIALQDGLMVAGQVTAPWKADGVAAFLPQIFGRVTQYSRELQMGQVQSVSVGMDQCTLLIFRAGVIYFAALARLGSPMPMTELKLVAAELNRHTK